MQNNAILCVLNAKYVHASPAVWYIAAGVHGFNKKNNTCLNTYILQYSIKQAMQDHKQVLHEILGKKSKVVAFSCYIWNIEQTLYIAKSIKEKEPNTIIVLGGPEVSYNAKQLFAENNFIDYIISGEGETSFANLFYFISIGKKPQKNEIEGLCTKQFISDPCTKEQIEHAYIDYGYAQQLENKIAYIETSRGCPYSCAFCLSGRCGNVKYVNLDEAYKSILTLANSGTQTVKFVDRTFNVNTVNANNILSFIKNNYGTQIPNSVCFHFEIAADILKQSTLDILKDMPKGAVQLEIGLQSFNEKTLEALRRKTDTKLVCENITKLIDMQNMHIHIDLIAGLIYEDITSFANSFNKAYSLGAHVLQMGFLKVLHGSAIETENDFYKCTYSKTPPYEVISTPWLCKKDIDVLHLCESELERINNTGRFIKTAKYAILATGKTPFDFYTYIGKKAQTAGFKHYGVNLDEYTEFLLETIGNMNGIDKQVLRDEMVRDRLCSNSNGRLPQILQVKDDNLGKYIKAINKVDKYNKQSNVKRKGAILYATNTFCFVDYINKNAVTNDYLLTEISIDSIEL